jgi:hypothetical protein
LLKVGAGVTTVLADSFCCGAFGTELWQALTPKAAAIGTIKSNLAGFNSGENGFFMVEIVMATTPVILLVKA